MRVIIPSRFNTFTKDYRLPLRATAGLFVLLLLMLAIRTYERGVLAGVLGDSNQKNNDYAILINKDKDAELTKNAVEQEKVTSNATPTTTQNTSLAINSDGSSSTTAPPTTTSTPPSSGGGTTPPPVTPPPAEPFSAQLAGFGLKSFTGPFACGSSGSGAGQYCKSYEFIAGIRTYNGPGTVTHVLRWHGVGTDQVSGSFSAATGDGATQVSTVVKLRCDVPGPYMFRFVVQQPNVLESHEIPIDHNCGGTPPPTTP